VIRTSTSRVWTAVVAAALFVCPGTAAATTGQARGAETVPAVWPAPQSMRPWSHGFRPDSSVQLEGGADAHPAAVGLVRRTLRSAGVRAVTDRGRTAVYVGGDAAAHALAALRVPGPRGLAPGGYVLTAGTDPDGAGLIVLSGADATGAFHTAQTLRQLVAGRSVRVGRQRDALAKISQRVAPGVLDPFLDRVEQTAEDER
jgi:hyaluronoglucosaminidase